MRFSLLLFSFFLCTASVSFADDLNSATLDAQWFCTADGYNFQNELVSVSGEYMPTEEEARESAKRTCHSYGLSVCQVRSCFNF